MSAETINLGHLTLGVGQGAWLELSSAGLPAPVRIGLPSFEIEGAARADFAFEGILAQRGLAQGGQEYILRFASAAAPALLLDLCLRAFPHSPILRLQYSLRVPPGLPPAHHSRRRGADAICYLSLSQAGLEQRALAEYQLSHFDNVAHSYLPLRVDRSAAELGQGLRFAGPAVLLHDQHSCLLAAYEHGADHPDAFLEFEISDSAEDGAVRRELRLCARKGNTFAGQPIRADQPWRSVWFEIGLFCGPLEVFLPRYREFFLSEVCLNPASRQPSIFYNTWNYQERQRYFHGRPYLESMTAERMLAEIEIAHRLGIEVFVIDTGWYGKTGDWQVNTARFPESLREVKRKLDDYGMQLGLWFNPTVAAESSRIFREHPEYEMTRGDEPPWRGPVWETEVSASMCLVSDYADDFIETMIRLHEEVGVSYFKWDAVAQYGCDSPLHQHGGADNSPQERADSYAYQMGQAMIRIVEEVSARCPGVIVDFDVTEGGRFVGLGFLSAGKYFLVNNGPYFHDFDIPASVKMEPNPINVFFYPGAARPRVCRTGARFDELIPSILFLTHYLPDGPQLAQRNSLASLMLGGNGVWGDLLALSEEEISFFAGQIGLYKQVRQHVTRAYPRRIGFAGSSPEIHEKLEAGAAAGLCAFFTVTPGEISHLTQPLDVSQLRQVIGADEWQVMPDGRVRLKLRLERNDARVVFFLPR